MKLKRNMFVLICDDNESDVKKLTSILDYSYGFAVKTVGFCQASDALSYIRSGADVDICFFETVTPGMNGIELAEQLREAGYMGEIVFLTASRVYGPDGFKVGALNYLLKPIMPEKVRGAISKAESKMENRRCQSCG